MWKAVSCAAILIASAAAGQGITSYQTNLSPEIKGEPDKIVCKKEETIGTRLGAKKVCLTVAEWNELARAHRERTEQIQSGTCMPGEGQGCESPL